MKKHLLRMWLVALMVFGATSTWAAGYTRTLTDALEVPGYTLKAFYDFQNNDPEVLPTSGDLRYRAYEKGGYWGLHNYGGGTRSGSATIPVAEGDILVVQHYSSSTVATIDCGTLNESLTASVGYQVYDITADAESIKFTIARGGGLVAALVMEVDANAETADYTINYVYEGTTIKTVTGEAVVGNLVLSDASFFVDDVKYFRANGEPESFIVIAGSNTFNVNVRMAETYNYTLTSSLSSTIATGSGYEGETVTIGYPRYAISGGAFYEASKTGSEYRKSITLSENNISATVEYAEKEGVNAVFFAEGENIEGMTESTKNNIPIRASNALAGVSSEDVLITTLPAGKYIFHAGIFTSKSSYGENTVNFGIGEDTFSAQFTNVNLCEVASDEFELTAETAIKFLGTTSWTDAQFDYLWIEKTGNIAITATFVNGAKWDAVFAYTFNPELNGAWPGQQIEKTGTKTINEVEYDVYTYSVDSNVVPGKIIFHNDGGTQTADLDFEIGKEYSYGLPNVEEKMDYYIVGNMTEWGPKAEYKMALNEGAETEEYVIKLNLTTTSQFKVAKSNGSTIADDAWYPTGMGNNYGENGEITVDGEYTIYFRPNADGGDDWFYKYIYAVAPSAEVDMTNLIVNADLMGEDGWDATGTKGLKKEGIVKVGSAAAFDFKQTIALPAGKYKVTAQAAYRYGGGDQAEQDEYDAIQAGTPTKFVQLYATVGAKTVATLVQNRWDGASDTDLAGSGAVVVNGKYVPNSSDAVKAWFAAGKYVNEAEFNVPADGNVTIGINRTGTPASDYTVIGPWTLTRLGDADPVVLQDFSVSFTTNAVWDKVYAYVWSGEGQDKVLGEWPGTEMTEKDGAYSITFQAEETPEKIIFNNGNGGTGNQTADLAFENGKAYEYNIELSEELTDLVENGTFDTPGVINPWKTTGGFQNQTTATNQNGAFTVPFFENWNGSAKVNKMYQEINNIPNGTYKLRIAAFVNNLANPNESQFVFANNDKVYLTTGEPTAYEVTTVVTDNKIEIGLEQTTATANWMGIDNVSLSYIGAKNQFVKEMAKLVLEGKQSVKTKNALQNAYDAFIADESNDNKEALKAAMAASKASINSYKILEAGILPDNSLEGWTCTTFVNGQDVRWQVNTWSNEGNSDGTGMVTPFLENWTPNAYVLGVGEIYYTLPGLDPGIYQFSALIRAYSEAGNAPTGASLFAGEREKEFSTGNYFEYNNGKLKGIYDTYAMACEVGEDGIFRFGIKVKEDRNFNWMAFKNCKIAYVGAAIDAAAVAELAATMPTGPMNADVKSAAETAIATATSNPNLDNYEAAAKAIAAAETSVAAYKNAKAAIDGMKAIMDNTNVYTTEAFNAYNMVYENNKAGYEAGTLTDAEANSIENPEIATAHRAATIVDNFLLSAWDTNPDFIDAPYYINTWSTEGANDGTNFLVPFFEYWTNDDKTLGEKTLTATMNGLEAGEYDVTAWVRVRIQNGAEAPAYGITLQANEGEAVNVTGDQVGTTQFFLKEVTATGTVDADGVLKIKFNIAAENNISWLSFKNVKYTKKAVEPEANYYIVGNMTNWAVSEDYKMTLNQAAETTEYMFTMDLTTTSQFKVVKVEGETQTWIPDGMGNAFGENGEIAEDGNYTIYFRPNADGGSDWFYNVIYALKNTSVGISKIEAEALKGNVYNLNGQKVTNVKKGLYIVNGKKAIKK